MAKRPIDIQELLVWAYRDQVIDEVPNRVGGPAVALMRWDVAVDGGDGGGEPLADAYTVAAAVRQLTRVQAALVIGSAKTAVAPEWFPGAEVVMAAVVNGRGHPAGLYDNAGHVVGHRVRSALELPDGTILYGWGSGDLADVRELYLVWHGALVVLARKLAAILDDFAVTGPDAQREPWLEAIVKAA